MEDNAFTQVMGPERHGRVRGLGLGPTPSMYRASASTSASASHHSDSPSSVHNEADDRIKVLEDQVRTLQETLGSMKNTFESQLSMICASLGLRSGQNDEPPSGEVMFTGYVQITHFFKSSNYMKIINHGLFISVP